jgi:hypothetical protein
VVEDLRPLLRSRGDELLVATTRRHDPDVERSWAPDPQPGTDAVIVRLRAGALDTSFGDGGVASASLMNAHTPISSETLYDVPLALALDDPPRVVAHSMSVWQSDNGGYTIRGPALGLVTLTAP